MTAFASALSGAGGRAKASSARASVTRSLISLGALVVVSDLGSNENLLPESWRREKSSKGGNLIETSSMKSWVGAEDDGESSASNGSFDAPRIGEEFGFTALCSSSVLFGLPRLMGTISGRTFFSSIGCTWYAPTWGGEAILGSGIGSC